MEMVNGTNTAGLGTPISRLAFPGNNHVFGPFTIARKPENGLPTKVSDGVYSLDRDFSSFGETNRETFSENGSPIGSWIVSDSCLGDKYPDTEVIVFMV